MLKGADAQAVARGRLAVLGAAVLWGTTGTAATFAPEVSAIAIGAAAMGIGGLLQALRATSELRVARKALCSQIGLLIFAALAVAIYPLAFYGSMRLAGVTVGTVVTIGAAPFLSALLEWAIDRQRLSARWLGAAMVGLAGVVCLSLSKPSGGDAAHSMALGVGLGLIGAFTYAFYTWGCRRMMQRGISARAAMGAAFGLGGIMLLPVLLISGASFLHSWGNAAVGAYMALVPMFLGYVLFGYGLARISASLATTLTLLEPLVAAGLAWLVVGERLAPLGWLGVLLVLACLVVVTYAPKARG